MLTFFVTMTNRTLFVLSLLAVFLMMASCQHYHSDVPEVPASKLPQVSIQIHRYGDALFHVDTTRFQVGIKALKKHFPYFLDANLNDTANLNKLYAYVTDTQMLHIYRDTRAKFPNLKTETQQISKAFSHLKYYFPHYRLPWVYTYISGLYFEQPILKKDTVLIIALDDYLGKNYLPYAELHIPLYHRRLMSREYMVVDVVNMLYFRDFHRPVRNKTLLDNMLEAGKQLYFLDTMMPQVADSLKIGYTRRQMQWMHEHKRDVWAVFVKNQFLYSTDYLMINKLTQPGPFTEGFSRKSPARMANWFGWQMVRSYMKRHPKMHLQDLLKWKDAQGLLEASGYKP